MRFAIAPYGPEPDQRRGGHAHGADPGYPGLGDRLAGFGDGDADESRLLAIRQECDGFGLVQGADGVQAVG